MSLDARIARIAAKQFGVFTLDQVLRLDGTRRQVEHRLATGRWERLYPGVFRIAGSPDTFRARVYAACLAADAVASHQTAAALWGLDGVTEDVLELSADRRVRVGTLRVHEVRDLVPGDLGKVGVIPTTSPTRTIIDLAAVVDVVMLETALDDALRRGLLSIARLRNTHERLNRNGRPGSGKVRVLLEMRPNRAEVPDSPLEAKMRRLLASAGLPNPELHYRVSERGRTIAIIDLAYPGPRIAIELDGYRYHHGRQRRQRDLARQNELINLGWRVLRFTNEDVERKAKDTVASVAVALGWPLPPSKFHR
jgi:hypothetical protein